MTAQLLFSNEAVCVPAQNALFIHSLIHTIVFPESRSFSKTPNTPSTLTLKGSYNNVFSLVTDSSTHYNSML